MTLVQNHQQQLSGNKKLKKNYLIFTIALLLGVSACTPKSSVLRAPSNAGQVSSNAEASKNAEEKAAEKEALAKEKKSERSIALLLPFKLDQINEQGIDEEDVKRSALALDFFQGFQIGLSEISQKSDSFSLKVIDSKDNVSVNSSLATSEEIENSGIIIGPIYPIEIKAFGSNLMQKDKLVINPLAASPASEFGLNNLVTITPTIKSHTNGMAHRVAHDYLNGDVILIYNTPDNDSKQFLNGMLSAIRSLKPNAQLISVSTLAQLNEKLTVSGTNLIISGTTDKTQLNNLINNLTKKNTEAYYSFRLYGHPLWERFDFSNHPNFYTLHPLISTESKLITYSQKVRDFRVLYKQKYGVLPSDQSFKGYDVAIYFGTLINKYGIKEIKSKLVTEPFSGLYNSYNFVYNENWGFTNEAVSFKEYINGEFHLE